MIIDAFLVAKNHVSLQEFPLFKVEIQPIGQHVNILFLCLVSYVALPFIF